VGVAGIESSSAILLTPPGSGAVAVVRLTGMLVQRFLEAHLSSRASLRRCVHADLTDGNEVIDDVVVVLLDEQTADLNLHGGTWVVQRILELARRGGFCVTDGQAMPLSPAAMDAADVLEGEILSHLPMVQTELGVRVLLAQRAAWKKLESVHPEVAELKRILTDVTLDCLLHPRRLAIVGAANVGKSTLANQLFARERSITADVPGTTRDWVGEIANIDGLPVMLLDTPGLRHTDDPIEAAAIGRSEEEVGRADAILLVIDASRPLDAEQSGLLQRFPSALRAVNKADKPHGWALDQVSAITTVATRGVGIDHLRREIVRQLCGQEPIEMDRPRCWTERQRHFLQAVIDDPDSNSKG
jgi:tRNA modification GTPase